jgi:hypothetical protein
MAIPRKATPVLKVGEVPVVRFARLVEAGLRDDLQRLHEDLLSEESRLTALEEIRWHSMKDFEALGEGGVTTTEAALYYTLFHHLTQEIDLQGRLVVTARRRLHDKQAALTAAAEERRAAERSHRGTGRHRTPEGAFDQMFPGGPRSVLKKAS